MAPQPFHLSPQVHASSTLALNERINALMAQGAQVYHMGFGESRFPVHPKILQAFHEHATARSYLPVAGLPELRQAVAAYYQREFGLAVEDSQVIVGVGSKSLLFAAIQVLQGDLLLPSPSWVSYEPQARLSGKAVTWIPTRPANNYCLTPDELRRAVAKARAGGQSPRILVLNTPHNPTGVMYSPALLAELAGVARAERLAVISDEIYAQTAYGNVPHTSVARFYPEGTVVTGGLSKHLSLGGWRLGVAVLPPGPAGAQLMAAMTAVASTIWTTAAAPVQHAAVVAYGDDPDVVGYVKTCAAIHGGVTRYLYQALREVGLPCPEPSGGFYLYPSFDPWREVLRQRHGVTTSDELAAFLLDEEYIATLPGTSFGADPVELSLRLSTSYLYALNDTDAESLLAIYQQSANTVEFLQKACPLVFEAGEKIQALVKSLA
ncbi:MAG: pyridoxal phosphate-dependent aminotransferase [Anaerolineae bacterium]